MCWEMDSFEGNSDTDCGNASPASPAPYLEAARQAICAAPTATASPTPAESGLQDRRPPPAANAVKKKRRCGRRRERRGKGTLAQTRSRRRVALARGVNHRPRRHGCPCTSASARTAALLRRTRTGGSLAGGASTRCGATRAGPRSSGCCSGSAAMSSVGGAHRPVPQLPIFQPQGSHLSSLPSLPQMPWFPSPGKGLQEAPGRRQHGGRESCRRRALRQGEARRQPRYPHGGLRRRVAVRHPRSQRTVVVPMKTPCSMLRSCRRGTRIPSHGRPPASSSGTTPSTLRSPPCATPLSRCSAAATMTPRRRR